MARGPQMAVSQEENRRRAEYLFDSSSPPRRGIGGPAFCHPPKGKPRPDVAAMHDSDGP